VEGADFARAVFGVGCSCFANFVTCDAVEGCGSECGLGCGEGCGLGEEGGEEDGGKLHG
jgi:hypothetical protein